MVSIRSSHRVNEYEDVFKIDKSGNISMIKVRLIQAMIQIVRPQGWNMERIIKRCDKIQ